MFLIWAHHPPALVRSTPSRKTLHYTKKALLLELMGLMDESRWNYRTADDETNKYLVGFFQSIQNDLLFQSLYPSLNDAERDKLAHMDQLL